MASLFQQGQIDISPGNFNAIQILKAQGVPVEFVAPKEGAIAFKTTMHITKGLAECGSCVQADRGGVVARGPDPTDGIALPDRTDQRKVAMKGEIAKVLAKDPDDLMKKFVFQDWKTINQGRAAWIDRFNREIAT